MYAMLGQEAVKAEQPLFGFMVNNELLDAPSHEGGRKLRPQFRTQGI